MKLLVIGKGGREHALACTFKRQGHTVFSIPGTHKIEANDFRELALFAQKHEIDLTVVGPEEPLAAGIADFFQSKGLPLFGPVKRAAQLESSKIFAKEFMSRHQIPTAEFVICQNLREANRTIETRFENWGGIVVKPDGLTGGKGVFVCKTKEDAKKAVSNLFVSEADKAVLERPLTGREVSLLCFSDGHTLMQTLPCQDHKRLLDEDKGPNTGGMGAFCPVALDDVTQVIINPILKGLKKEGIVYKGILFIGLLITEQGPKILEFNCRFGDPETQTLLPLLESDLAKIMLACTQGTLQEQSLKWSGKKSCTVIATAEGYPYNPMTGRQISGIEEAERLPETMVFHAAAEKRGENFFTTGGRVLAVTALGQTLQEAAERAYEGASLIHFEGMHYRKDIARRTAPC